MTANLRSTSRLVSNRLLTLEVLKLRKRVGSGNCDPNAELVSACSSRRGSCGIIFDTRSMLDHSTGRTWRKAASTRSMPCLDRFAANAVARSTARRTYLLTYAEIGTLGSPKYILGVRKHFLGLVKSNGDREFGAEWYRISPHEGLFKHVTVGSVGFGSGVDLLTN